jgi:hypothetical protein
MARPSSLTSAASIACVKGKNTLQKEHVVKEIIRTVRQPRAPQTHGLAQLAALFAFWIALLHRHRRHLRRRSVTL